MPFSAAALPFPGGPPPTAAAVFTMLSKEQKQQDKTQWEFYKLNQELDRAVDYLVRAQGTSSSAITSSAIAVLSLAHTLWAYGCLPACLLGPPATCGLSSSPPPPPLPLPLPPSLLRIACVCSPV